MEKYIITITRSYGSGGLQIGKLLSEALDIPYYNDDIITKASETSGIKQELFITHDEELKNSFFKRLASTGYKGKLLSPDNPKFTSEENLFNFKAAVIKEFANEGSCIIIGRCADYILKDYDRVIRLFVHAPEDTCIKNVQSVHGVSYDEAKKRVLEINQKRKEYYEYYTQQKWHNAENYDLCLNTEMLSFDTCVEIVKGYIEIVLKNKS